jgi:hypothetical protein
MDQGLTPSPPKWAEERLPLFTEYKDVLSRLRERFPFDYHDLSSVQEALAFDTLEKSLDGSNYRLYSQVRYGFTIPREQRKSQFLDTGELDLIVVNPETRYVLSVGEVKISSREIKKAAKQQERLLGFIQKVFREKIPQHRYCPNLFDRD